MNTRPTLLTKSQKEYRSICNWVLEENIGNPLGGSAEKRKFLDGYKNEFGIGRGMEWIEHITITLLIEVRMEER